MPEKEGPSEDTIKKLEESIKEHETEEQSKKEEEERPDNETAEDIDKALKRFKEERKK